jgi:hypothetical protein
MTGITLESGLGRQAGKSRENRGTAFPQDQRVDTNLVSPRILRLAAMWSGRWESNPHGQRVWSLKTSSLAQLQIPSVISV